MKGAAMHRAFLLFKKKRRGVTASPQRVEKVRLPRPFPPKTLEMFAPGRKLPARPAKPGDTISFWRAVAPPNLPKEGF